MDKEVHAAIHKGSGRPRDIALAENRGYKKLSDLMHLARCAQHGI